jgi:hypothetical protein
LTLEDFKTSLVEQDPHLNWPAVLTALWHDGKGNWNAAHDIVQDLDNPDGSLIHAYLHRKEGDLSNAAYWYNRAGTRPPETSLQEEWSELVETYLGK